MNGHHAWRRGPLVRAVAAITLANAPFWWLAQTMFINRAVINVDLIGALVLMAIWPASGLVLLLLAWGLDAAVAQSLTYHFLTPIDYLRSAAFAGTLRWTDLLRPGMLAPLLAFVPAAVLLPRLVARSRDVAVVMLALGAVLTGADALNGSALLGHRSTWLVPVNVAGSPVSTVAALALRSDTTRKLTPLPIGETIQGLVDMPAWAATHPDRSVLLVVVESLGQPADPDLRVWLASRIGQGPYRVDRSELPFRGATTSGELRALCRLAGPYRRLDETAGRDCLPARIAGLGWSTLGVHGFSRQMFDREHWWRLTGLQTIDFIDADSLRDAPRCGQMLRGACDHDVVARALAWLRTGRRFAYVLTLQTHLPLGKVEVPAALAARCEQKAIPADACALTAALGEVLADVTAMAGAEARPPLLVIVGDHAPPFGSLDSRAAFLSDRVPAFALKPRD